VKVNEETYGEVSDRVEESLVMLAYVYGAQEDYDHVKTVALRALRIEETLHGKDGEKIIAPLSFLCSPYGRWNKPDKAEP
jgi:hypothetical protein